MKFLEYTDEIREGDTVIVYISSDDLKQIVIKRGQTYQSKFGGIKHDNVIGKPWGWKYNCAKGYVYLLFPTCELWSLSLRHRTQILYLADISRIIFELNLSPGSVVCESGTGSGSLSHSMIRAVAPTGHLHTVEFHEERSKIARDEFADHSLSDSVTVYHRDVIELGFPESIDHTADAVFLDIPAPYKCIGHVKRALKLNGGYFCNFSPCIEQTQKTCDELRKEGFNEIRTIELINNAKNVKTYSMPLPEFGVELEQLVKADILPDLSKTDSGYLSTRGSRKRIYEEMKLNECNYNYKSVVGRRTQYGHTGYLTFATLPPRKES